MPDLKNKKEDIRPRVSAAISQILYLLIMYKCANCMIVLRLTEVCDEVKWCNVWHSNTQNTDM